MPSAVAIGLGGAVIALGLGGALGAAARRLSRRSGLPPGFWALGAWPPGVLVSGLWAWLGDPLTGSLLGLLVIASAAAVAEPALDLRRPSWINLVHGGLLGVAVAPGAALLGAGAWRLWFLWDAVPSSQALVSGWLAREGAAWWIGAAQLGLLLPFLEELLFRGHVWGLFTRVAPDRPQWAIWGTTLLFVGFHLNEPWSVAPIGLLGVCVGWLRRRSGSVWPPIACHASYNLMFVYLAS